MQLYVCVKHVPDSAAHIAILDKNRIDETVSYFLNPYDEHALTEAARVKKDLPESEIIAVCLGKEDAENTLRSALAMGADRGILILSSTRHDSIETAQALKIAIEQDGKPGLIFTGKESIDAEGMQTLFRIGALFDFPVATNVIKFDLVGNTAVVESGLSGGAANTYEMSLPCVLGAGRGLNTPRYPTFPDVVKSKKKPIKKLALTDLKARPSLAGMNIIALEPLVQSRKPKEITGDAEEAAKKIVKILREEAKVLV